jgi:ubiquinone/menaquinone biosynthesis C-methylase UbiE
MFSGPDSVFADRPASTLSWLDPLDPSMVVLDVACGAAHVAELAAPHVRQVVGVDLTPALLQLGAGRLRDARIDNILLQEGNAASLPFVDDSFDLVYSRLAFHHMADPAASIAEMKRVCRPGGRVVVEDLVAPAHDVRGAFDQLHRSLDESHATVFLAEELAELVETAVGPITHGQISTLTFDFRESQMSAAAIAPLRGELSGGPATGFQPAMIDDDTIRVTFIYAVVHAIAPAA